jgi:SAM-dependent methyltransferase
VGVRHLVASDIAPVAVRRLQSAFPDCRVVRLDIGDPALPPSLSDFGLVSAFDVLFHIVDDERYRMALRNIGRLLRPGGWFVFSENFVQGETQRFEHQVTRSRAEIEAAVNDAGLDVITRRPMMAVMNSPVDSRRRFLRFGWKVMTSPARIHDSFGWALGAALFPLDLALTRLLHEGPSTEVCLCRKRSD